MERGAWSGMDWWLDDLIALLVVGRWRAPVMPEAWLPRELVPSESSPLKWNRLCLRQRWEFLHDLKQ